MEIKIHDKTFRPFIDSDAIAARIREMGDRMTEDYRDKNPLFLAVLNGAFIFAADLFRCIDTRASVSFVRLSSYAGDASTGAISIHLGLTEKIEGRHVIIVEDIIDTGTTLHQFLPMVRGEHPASLKVAAFLVKPEALQHPDVRADYSGFEIADKFVVGYGLDYDGLGRNLPELYQQAD